MLLWHAEVLFATNDNTRCFGNAKGHWVATFDISSERKTCLLSCDLTALVDSSYSIRTVQSHKRKESLFWVLVSGKNVKVSLSKVAFVQTGPSRRHVCKEVLPTMANTLPFLLKLDS